MSSSPLEMLTTPCSLLASMRTTIISKKKSKKIAKICGTFSTIRYKFFLFIYIRQERRRKENQGQKRPHVPSGSACMRVQMGRHVVHMGGWGERGEGGQLSAVQLQREQEEAGA